MLLWIIKKGFFWREIKARAFTMACSYGDVEELQKESQRHKNIRDHIARSVEGKLMRSVKVMIGL